MVGKKNRSTAATAALLPGEKQRALFGAMAADLTHGALKVLVALIWHTNAKTGRCDPSASRLAHETHLSERQVYRAINELEDASLLVRNRHSGSAFCNAYVIRWAELNSRYQQWLIDNGLVASTPDTDDRPPLTEATKTPDAKGTQIREELENRTGEESRSSSSSSLKRDDASRDIGFQGVQGIKAAPHRNIFAEPRAPASAKVAREKAHQRFDEDLRKHLSADAYVEFVDRVDTATVENAIAAEVSKPGTSAGVQLALATMQDKLPTVTPIADAADGFPEIPEFLRRM